MTDAWWTYALNDLPILRAATFMGFLPLAVKPCGLVIQLSFEAMSLDNSELTLFFFSLDKVFVFVMVVCLEQYNLLLSANSHVEPGQFIHTRYVEYLEQEEQELIDCVGV